MNYARVIFVEDPNVFEGDIINPEVVARMLAIAITKLLDTADAATAWKALFHPDDVVGIKVNCLAGRGASTHPEVAEAIVAGLQLVGIPEEHVLIWDRANRDLKRSGFSLNSGRRGVKCFGTDALLGGGYDTKISTAGQVGSLFSSILSTHCTALVNVPMLKDHDLSGVSIGMKNFYGAIHNPNKYHQNNCNPYIADLNTHPFIREKVKLTVCDALLAQYHGGPSYKPQWSWKACALLLSLDPVALDVVGANILEQERLKHGMETFRQAGRPPDYIQTAAEYGLGEADLSKIDIIRC